MSYRTKIDSVQIFGNNEAAPEWFDFITSHGITIDEDGIYKGEITDVEGLFKTIEKITRRLIRENHERVERHETMINRKPVRELYDLTDSMWFSDHDPILMFNQMVAQNYYIFLPYQVYKILEDKLERCERYKVEDGDPTDWSFCSYKLKDGETIMVSAS